MFKKILNSKFKKDLLFSYLSQGITISFGFLQLFLINRYFGVATFGQLAVIMSTTGIFSSLLTARSSEAVTRFFKREELKKNYENAKFVLFIGFSIDFITAILLVALMYFASSFIAITFLKDIKLQDEIIVYSLITFIVFLRGSMVGFLQSKEMFVKLNIITIIESISKIIVLLAFIFVLHKVFLIDIIYSFLVATIVSFLYTMYVFLTSYLKEYKNVKYNFNKRLLKEYWRFNIKTFLSSSLKAGNQNIDNLIIGYFLSVETVGIYQVLKKILTPILIVATPFSTLVYPKLIHFFETNQREKFKNIIIKISLYILIIGIIYSLASCLFLNKIFLLINIEFLDSYYIFFILLIGLTILNSQMWWVRIFSNTVNPNYSLYMNMFATAFQLTITVFMTYLFGLEGLIVSTIIMNLLIVFYWLRRVKEYVRKTIHIYIDLYLNKLRILILKLRGAKVGKGVKSFGKFKVMNPKNLVIRDYSTLNEGVFLNCRDKIEIGSNCHISPNVQMYTDKLVIDKLPRIHPSEKVIIEDNVWIASRSVILSGVKISKNSVIGANSVVINNVDSNYFYAGNPAKKIKEI